MLKRKIYDDLVAWKQRSGGTTALLIDGARRVGKSFIAKEFAENEYKSHIIIDFGNVPKDVLDIFENDSTDLDMFFAKLSVFFGVQLYNRESLIVFDEVQQFPRARQLIKYLVADGRYDYLETGSLIRLKKNVKDIIIPSEEEHLEMFPLDFEEFLWALDDEVTVPFIRQAFEAQKTLGQAVHRKVMNQLPAVPAGRRDAPVHPRLPEWEGLCRFRYGEAKHSAALPRRCRQVRRGIRG